MSTSSLAGSRLPSQCPDCAVSTTLTVAAAGRQGFYVGYICPSCLYAVDILGVLATGELAQAMLFILDPPGPARASPTTSTSGN
jgi:hypothetical protein